MSIRRMDDGFEINCDECSASQEFQTGHNWQEFITEAKEAVWHMVFDGTAWLHFCDEHKAEAEEVRRKAREEEP